MTALGAGLIIAIASPQAGVQAFGVILALLGAGSLLLRHVERES